MKLTHIDLFSGIGGFSLALDNVYGKENVEHIFCDNEPFAQEVLKKHWPTSKIYGDIRKFQGKKVKADILTGGFPCQPFSRAGRRRAKSDDRYLWPEMLRVIRETKPTWIIGENTPDIKNLALDEIWDDLESADYSVQAFDIPAGAVGSPQYRYRTWIVANTNEKRCGEPKKKPLQSRRSTAELRSWWSVEPPVGRVAYGLPRQLDRGRGIGNAIVPQVAEEIMRAIKQSSL